MNEAFKREGIPLTCFVVKNSKPYQNGINKTFEVSKSQCLSHFFDFCSYSHSIAPKQFRVGIIICTICGSFDYLIYPYSPAYIPSCYHFVISVDNSKGI